MLTVRFVVVVLSLAALTVGMYFFDSRVYARFKYRFFSKKAFAIITFGMFCLTGGIALHANEISHHQSEALSDVLFVLSCVAFWWILTLDFIKTNLAYGLIGAIVQMAVFVSLSCAGMFLAMMMFGFFFALTPVILVVFFAGKRVGHFNSGN